MMYDELITHHNTYHDIKNLKKERNEIEDKIIQLMKEQKKNHIDEKDLEIGALARDWLETDDTIKRTILRRREWMLKKALRGCDDNEEPNLCIEIGKLERDEYDWYSMIVE